MTGVYPLFLALLAVVMLLQNLLCTVEYEHMTVWHRNSVITYVQYLFAFSCLVSAQAINLRNRAENTPLQESLLRVQTPLVALAAFACLKTVFVRHRHQRTARAISILLIL